MAKKKETILIIEQEANLANGLKSILEKEGYRVVSVFSHYHLKALCKSKRPDLAIININVPTEFGLNILRKTRESFPVMPIIAMSVYSNSFTKKELSLLGVNDFIAKPFDIEYLKDRIEKLFNTNK